MKPQYSYEMSVRRFERNIREYIKRDYLACERKGFPNDDLVSENAFLLTNKAYRNEDSRLSNLMKLLSYKIFDDESFSQILDGALLLEWRENEKHTAILKDEYYYGILDLIENEIVPFCVDRLKQLFSKPVYIDASDCSEIEAAGFFVKVVEPDTYSDFRNRGCEVYVIGVYESEEDTYIGKHIEFGIGYPDSDCDLNEFIYTNPAYLTYDVCEIDENLEEDELVPLLVAIMSTYRG